MSKKQKPRFKIHDGLRNIYTNIGTQNDSRTYNRWQYSPFFYYQELDCCYRESFVARKIVDIVANDATRNWRSFKNKENDILHKAEYDLMLPQHYNELLRLARLSGGALMLMIIDGQDLREPIQVKNIQKGDFRRLINFDRYEVYASDMNVTDVLSPNYLLPEYYMVQGGEFPIHYSHFVRMNGEWLPRRLNRSEYGWGDSVLRKCMDNLKDLAAASDSMAGLIVKSNIDVLAMEGFFQAISSGHDDDIINAIQSYKLGLSTTNVAVTDATSRFERHGVSMGGVSEAIAELRIQIASAANVPVTRFWGEQSAGLNNNQEGDMKNYYDYLRGLQESVYRHSLQILDYALCRTALGEVPEDFEWDWNPLFELTTEEQSNRDMNQAQIDQIRIDQGVPVSSVLRNIQSENKYSIDDDYIEQIEKEEQQSHGDTDLALSNALGQYTQQQKTSEISQTRQGVSED